jgi:uncharacterized damage-inducible protein DinB
LKAKDLLLKQLHDAYSGFSETSLQASLRDLSQEEASWRLNDTSWTIGEIVYHVAACEIELCRQGFGKGLEHGKPVDDIEQAIKLLDRAHALLVGCLEALPEEDLDKPIPTEWHGESATHFFWVMVMHRISHAAQIRTIRRAYGSRTHFNPV